MTKIKFFPKGPKTNVTIVTVSESTEKNELFKLLIGLTIRVRPGISVPDNRGFYLCSALWIVKALKKANRDTTDWDEINPKSKVYFLASTCKI